MHFLGGNPSIFPVFLFLMYIDFLAFSFSKEERTKNERETFRLAASHYQGLGVVVPTDYDADTHIKKENKKMDEKLLWQ